MRLANLELPALLLWGKLWGCGSWLPPFDGPPCPPRRPPPPACVRTRSRRGRCCAASMVTHRMRRLIAESSIRPLATATGAARGLVAPVEGRREVAADGVQEVLHALVLVRGAHEHGAELQRQRGPRRPELLCRASWAIASLLFLVFFGPNSIGAGQIPAECAQDLGPILEEDRTASGDFAPVR